MPEEEKVYCSMYSRNAELYHHGIKGQKWGVRNGPPYPLGSGKGSSRSAKEKRLNDDSYDGSNNNLDNMKPNKLQRQFKKQIFIKRKELGISPIDRYDRLTPIGPNSKKLISEWKSNERKYYNSEEYKKWYKKLMEVINEDWDDWDEHGKKYEKIVNSRPKKKYLNLNSVEFIPTAPDDGEYWYDNKFNSEGGKVLTIAYLKDLGYSDSEAIKYTEKLLKNNLTLGDV